MQLSITSGQHYVYLLAFCLLFVTANKILMVCGNMVQLTHVHVTLKCCMFVRSKCISTMEVIDVSDPQPVP